MEPVILALENKYAGKVDFIVVDIDKPDGQTLAAQYNVNTIPAYFTLGKNGVIIETVTPGEYTQSQLETKIEKLLKEYK